MSNRQCQACYKVFSKEQGLSTHFQHNKECKLLHYNLFHNVQNNTKITNTKSNASRTTNVILNNLDSFISSAIDITNNFVSDPITNNDSESIASLGHSDNNDVPKELDSFHLKTDTII